MGFFSLLGCHASPFLRTIELSKAKEMSIDSQNGVSHKDLLLPKWVFLQAFEKLRVPFSNSRRATVSVSGL